MAIGIIELVILLGLGLLGLLVLGVVFFIVYTAVKSGNRDSKNLK
jgi:hypothetical protein